MAEGRRDQSCGCMHFELIARTVRKHSDTNTPLYRTWKNMKTRCYWPKHQYFKNYGGKGIRVCPEWINDFSAFREWAQNNGYAEGMSIDRINSDKDYTPDNCQWISLPDNARKDRIGKPGHKPTDEEKAKMSDQRKGRKFIDRKSAPLSGAHKANIANGLSKHWKAKKG